LFAAGDVAVRDFDPPRSRPASAKEPVVDRCGWHAAV
jgi:hypothetical protein